MNSSLKYNISVVLRLMVIVFSLTSFSCNKTDDENGDEQGIEESVALDVESTTLDIGEELTVKPTFTPNVKPQLTYRWITSNPAAVGIKKKEDYSAVISAHKKGTSKITFSSSDGNVKASFEVTVAGSEQDDDGVVKVLAIGNSFSQDAIENYLYELASSENVPMVIGNLYIGGASLQKHWKNAQNNAAAYSYRKIAKNGSKTTTPNTSIATAVADENWDYISFQQVSGNSGKYETFVTPLPALVNYVKERSTNADAQYIIHQTWAYAENSTHSNFPKYESDQEVMYEAIVNAVRKAKTTFDMDYLVPSGTAIQNGRNTLIGDNFNRDGYHLDKGIGRYTAACTWFEALTSINVVGNTFKPDVLSDLDAEIAQHAAHAAILAPDKVTELPDYAASGTKPLEAPVLINFGYNNASEWNTLGEYIKGASIPNLKDKNDAYTNISLTVTERFNSINKKGEKNTNTDFDMTADISQQSYYGNTGDAWRELNIKQSQITFSGLDKDATYHLCFFGSRSGVSDNRDTKYIVAGARTETVNLQAAKNTDKTICASKIQPDSKGNIIVTITAGDDNDNKNGFYYLNAMRLASGE